MARDTPNHAQRERLAHLDRCFAWRGVANRRDLVDRFGISVAQAALDFRAYLDRRGAAAPVYDPAARAYVVAEGKVPPVPSTPLDDFAILAMPGEGDGDPPAMLPRPARRVDPVVVARLYRAIAGGEVLRLRYTSMTSGAGEARRIAPVRFTSDGESVHVRAYCLDRGAYRFFLPAGIEPGGIDAGAAPAGPLPPDIDWNTRATIRLRPRAGLSPAQARAVRREYGFDGAFLTLETRKALEFFIPHRWGLDGPGSRLEIASVEHAPL